MTKRLTGMLLALLLALTLFPLAADAADNNGSFGITENPRENIRFILGSNKLTVANLPNKAAFGSVWVNIVNLDGRILIKQILDRTADGSVSMSLSGLSSGKYYIELYFSTAGDHYTSYIFGDEIRFQWSNGSGEFILSPVYEHNKKTYDAGRSDNAALAHYLSPTRTIQSSDAGIVKLAAEITNGITDEYNKALAIHDWVCVNIWYDWDVAGSGRRTEGDAVSTLKNRRAVCNGYSNLTAALLRAVGIPAKTVNGFGRTTRTGGWTQSKISGNSTNHVWNEAYVDGRWIIIDTTWDSGNDYRGGKKVASDGLYYSRYFDATLEAISINHRIHPYAESSIPQPLNSYR